MSINNIILTIAIFFTFWWTSINITRFAKSQSIPSNNFILMSIGWTAIITHIIGIWQRRLTMTNTTQMLSELYRIYDALNEHYWESSLPPVFITIVPGNGTFTPESWAKNEGTEVDENGNETTKTGDIHHEIAMSAEYFTRPIPNWCATLQHEMVHLYCQINEIEDTSNNGVYHNKRFKVEAEKRGLIIEKADVIGWSVTTPDSDFIAFINELEINEDTFSYFRQTRFAPIQNSTKKRFVCPICKLQAQAKKGSLIKCGEHDVLMDYWDLTDPDAPEILEDLNDGLYMSEDGWYSLEGFC